MSDQTVEDFSYEDRRGRMAKRVKGYSLHDYVLLIMAAAIGLVFVRMFFIYGIVTSACAEHFATLGIPIGEPNAGQSVWEQLSLISWLIVGYGASVHIFDRKVSLWVASIRGCLIVVMAVLAIGLRMITGPDFNPPDDILLVSGDILLQMSPNELSDIAVIGEVGIDFPTHFARPICVYNSGHRNLFVTSRMDGRVNGPLLDDRIVFGQEGAWTKALQAAQIRVDLTDAQMQKLYENNRVNRRRYNRETEFDTALTADLTP